MEKKDLAKRYAQRTGATPAQAADQIDRVIHDLLRRLRSGEPASLPGFGTLLPNDNTDLKFDQTRTARKASK